MKITVVGCGRWGSLITWYLDTLGHEITLYGRASSVHMQQFLTERKNDLLSLPERVALSTSLESTVDADVIVVSIASQALRGFFEEFREKVFTTSALL